MNNSLDIIFNFTVSNVTTFDNYSDFILNITESENIYNVNATRNVTLFQKYPSELLYFAAACCIAFIFVGIPGNFITVVALAKSLRLKNATSAFIINLCVADGLYCAFTLPLAASSFIHKSWIHGDVLCMLFPLFRYSNAAVSLFSVMAITINRYVIIVHPKRYSKIYTKVSICIIIFAIWFLSFLLVTPTALGVWGKFGFNTEVGTCSMVKVNGKSSKNFIYIMAFFIPSFVFAFCYSRIFWVVRKSERKLKTGRGLKKEEKRTAWYELKWFKKKEEQSKADGKRKQKLSKDLKLLKVIFVIFLAFIFCYFPVIFVKIFNKETSLPALNILGYLGAYCSACINPIIYVIMSKEYRRAYKELFVCNKNIRPTNSSDARTTRL